jgi:tRNA dimethylallyltransferase
MDSSMVTVVCGPTGVGKTAYSLELASKVGAEVICMDAFQLYRELPILSAAPTQEERAKVVHHLFGILDPLDRFSLAQYYQRAAESLKNLVQQGKPVIFVGGAGLYLRVLERGLDCPESEAHPEFRAEKEELAKRFGSEKLHQDLEKLDPVAANRLHPRDTRRIIRALEKVSFSSGPAQRLDLLSVLGLKWRKICFLPEREALYQKLRERVDQMIEAGVEDEVQRLLERGLTTEHTAYQAIGLKETASYLCGSIDKEEWIRLFKRNTCRFAKRQKTWFKSMGNTEYLYDFYR